MAALFLMLALTACEHPGSPRSTPVADQTFAESAEMQRRGEWLFRRGVRPSCHACHSLQAGRTIVGPSLAGVGNKGEEYLWRVITQEDVPPTPGFADGVMPVRVYAKWREEHEEQVADLVSFLLTLR